MDISSNVVDDSTYDDMPPLVEAEKELEYPFNSIWNKVKELELENEDLVEQVGGLIVEAREARRSFTAFQLAVSLLVFVYGMMYGKYSC
jgi:hypothetical protein